MNGIAFAEPLFLYLLIVVPALIVFYILKQQKSYCFSENAGIAIIC